MNQPPMIDAAEKTVAHSPGEAHRQVVDQFRRRVEPLARHRGIESKAIQPRGRSDVIRALQPTLDFQSGDAEPRQFRHVDHTHQILRAERVRPLRIDRPPVDLQLVRLTA